MPTGTARSVAAGALAICSQLRDFATSSKLIGALGTIAACALSRPPDAGPGPRSRPPDAGPGLRSRPPDAGPGPRSRPPETDSGPRSRPPESDSGPRSRRRTLAPAPGAGRRKRTPAPGAGRRNRTPAPGAGRRSRPAELRKSWGPGSVSDPGAASAPVDPRGGRCYGRR